MGPHERSESVQKGGSQWVPVRPFIRSQDGAKNNEKCVFFRLWTLPDGPEKKTIHLNYLIWLCINGIGGALSEGWWNSME